MSVLLDATKSRFFQFRHCSAILAIEKQSKLAFGFNKSLKYELF